MQKYIYLKKTFTFYFLRIGFVKLVQFSHYYILNLSMCEYILLSMKVVFKHFLDTQ